MYRATATTAAAALWVAMLAAPASSGPASGPSPGAESSAASGRDDPLAACVDDDPCVEVRCVYTAHRAIGRAAAIRRLEALHRRHTDSCTGLQLARALWPDRRARPERVEALLEAAMADDSPAAVEARILLGRRAGERGDFDRAESLLAEGARRAEDLGDDLLRLKASLDRATLAIDRGDRLGEAYRALARLHDEVCVPRLRAALDAPSSPWGAVLQNCFSSYGRAAYNLGGYEKSRGAYEHLAELSAVLGDEGRRANALYMQAANDSELRYPDEETRTELLAAYRAALELAEGAGHPVRFRLVHQLGLLTPELEDARRYFERCLEVATGADRRGCQTAYAARLAPEAPERASELISEVLASDDATLAAADPWFLIYAWRDLARYFWATRPPPAAVESSLELLAAIETLLDRQTLGLDRAVLGAVWADAYYWLAGRLLELADADEAAGLDFDPVERAFEVIERLRARVLLETLATGKASAADPPDPLAAELLAELDGVLAAKVRLHRRLLDPGLDAATRRAALAELERLRRKEADRRAALARARDERAAPPPARATLGELAASLERDEALLLYQLFHDRAHDGRFAGGAWLLVVTWQGTRHYRLPRDLGYFDAADNRIGAVEALRRELAAPAADDAVPASAGLVAVSRALLEPALAELPRGVERLVIVPDGVLYQVPFGALRLASGDEPLLERHQLALVPSATLWLRWREEGTPAADRPSLVLADPTLAIAAEAAGTAAAAGDERAARRSFFLERVAELPPLAGARAEAAEIACRLGPSTEVHLDDDASEERLKDSDPGGYGVVHFGTHAFVDERRERSAVLLAPGAAAEDGLLEPAEIAALDLEGSLVVLAACDSARGRVLRGEGVIGLARAFFLAGARAVVATLERIDDREAAWLFGRFYRHLAAGAAAREALAEAQRDGRRAGLTEATLASVVLLGDGDLVPFPGGSGARCPRDWLRPAGVVAVVVGLLFLGGWLVGGRRGG